MATFLSIVEEFWLRALLFSISLAFLISTEPTYRTLLFEISLTVIKQFQSTSTDFSIELMKIISDIGGEGLIYGTLLLMYFFASNARSFYYVIVNSLAIYFMSIGKLAYHQPRPYMVDDDIDVHGCSVEFGQPSGHSMTSMTYCIVLYLDLLTISPQGPYVIKAILGVIAGMTPILTGFSRLYNANHSIDQIIYGWSLGVWLGLFCHYCLRDFVLTHISRLENSSSSSISKQEYQRYFMIATSLFLAFFGGLILTYQVVDSTFTVPSSWETKLYTKCGETLTYNSFSGASFVQGCIISLFIGAYYGILFISFKMVDLDQLYIYTIAKYAASSALFLPFLSPLLLKNYINNAYIGGLCIYFIPLFGFGLIFYGVGEYWTQFLGGNVRKIQKPQIFKGKNGDSYKIMIIQ